MKDKAGWREEKRARECYLCDVKRAPDFTVISDEMLKGKVRKWRFIITDHSSSFAGLTKQQEVEKRENFEWLSAVYLSVNHPPSIAKSFFYVVEFS